MSDSANSSQPKPLTTVQWLICVIAAIGFLFDTYELLMLPLILRPALQELGGLRPGTPEFQNWASLLFYVPAFFGGICGLIGGYLTDRFGRRQVLVWSILIYAFSACGAAFATSLPALLVLRTTTFIGVCVEFVAAVAWLAELFPNSGQKEKVLGWTQAFGSLGGLLVSQAYESIAHNPDSLPAIYGDHAPWRYILISGVLPAIPLIVIRPFLPESASWAEKKAAGTLKRPSISELFAPELARTTIMATILMACCYGAAFGAIQQIPQIVPTLPELAGIPRPQQQPIIGGVQKMQEIGGLTGRILLAILALYVVRRGNLLRLFLAPGILVVPYVFYTLGQGHLDSFKIGVAVAGLLTVAQFSFWGNYLPRAFPVHLRGTGESFAANIGGRLIGTSAALVVTQMAKAMPMAQAAAIVGGTVYVIGFIASFFLPEPTAADDHE